MLLRCRAKTEPPMLKFSSSEPSSLLNGFQLTNAEKNLRVAGGDEAVAGAVEDARGVVERVVEEPAEGHDAEVAVLAEVVEEDRPLGGDQALDRLDEELVGERRLEAADPELEPGVVVEVEEDVEQLRACRSRWPSETK